MIATAPDSAAPTPDRRSTSRVKSFLKGQILADRRTRVFDCVIRNISDVGAKIEIGASVPVPEEFELSIPQRSATFLATIRWRKNDEMGVALRKPDPLVAKLAALEAENARLRALVKELQVAATEGAPPTKAL